MRPSVLSRAVTDESGYQVEDVCSKRARRLPQREVERLALPKALHTPVPFNERMGNWTAGLAIQGTRIETFSRTVPFVEKNASLV